MATIPQYLSQYAFVGAELDLSTASFRANLRAVYRLSDNRQGYASWKSGTQFPAFTKLTPALPGEPRLFAMGVCQI